MPTTYATGTVLLSFLISAVGAFVALAATSRLLDRHGRVNAINLLAAGLALGGVGIWSMHFIGMLALRVGMGIGYAMPETIGSLGVAVAGSTAALWLVARDVRSLPRLVAAGALLGTAVCAMHYLGMYGMRFGGYFEWSYERIGASAVIAFAAATAALWLAFRVHGILARTAAALVMATAVCAMHYTGMSAADFICTTPTPANFPQGFAVITSLQLPVLVTVLSLGMAFVIAVDQVFQRIAAGAHRTTAQPVRVPRAR